jgi:acyl dehydratase
VTSRQRSNAGPLYVEELSVGDEFRSTEYVVGENQIKEFAKQYDPQPFHLDAVAAQKTLFGGLVASGMHVASITMHLLIKGGGLPVACEFVGLSSEIVWPNPTRPGDVLHLETTVMSVTPSRARPDRSILAYRCNTVNQHGAVVQRLLSRVIVLHKNGRSNADQTRLSIQAS